MTARIATRHYCAGCDQVVGPGHRCGRTGSTYRWRQIRARVLERDGYRCRYCGAVAETVDHYLPVSLGGTDDPDNLVACCESCNKRKGEQHPLEFQEQGR